VADVFKMPKLGESVTTGTVTRWLMAVGDPVDMDDPLLEVSTDKVDSEIPSPFSGVLLEILVPEGETVEIGAELARIGAASESGGAEPDGQAPGADATSAPPSVAPAPAAVPLPPAPAAVPAPAAPTGNGGGRALLSPIVRQLAVEHGIDLTTVQGSGATGRIMREDVEAAIARAAASQPQTAAPSAPPATAASAAPPVITPSAPPTPSTVSPAAPPATAAKLGPRDEAEPLSRMRLAIGERMIESLRIAPHVWTSVEVDLQAVEEVRRRHKERFRREEGMSLTYLGFIARATCDALRAFPAVNSSVDMKAKTRILHHYVNLGIAVDLREQGLVAPVVRDADGLNLRGLARAIRAAADKVTGGKFTNDDLTGSTFTITNPGPFGDYASAPIINQPNAAILSTNMVSRRPTAVGDAVAVHYMTILGFSYDHRAFDGVTASRFLAYIRDALQDRDWEAELG
jgi:2-oxoglutarate dehydrogenase E2 component (dihydrolipoamide succinyltransferase)